MSRHRNASIFGFALSLACLVAACSKHQNAQSEPSEGISPTSTADAVTATPQVANPTATLPSDTDVEKLKASKKYNIVSDIDDTIRAVALKAGIEVIPETLETEQFYGLNALYRMFANQNATSRHIFYVTGAMKTADLYKLGQAFLQKYNFPELSNYTYKDTTSSAESLEDYKVRVVSKIITDADAETQFVFLGDNGQKDPVVYDKVATKFPSRVAKTFIHEAYLPNDAKGEYPIKPTQQRYLTSVDLALSFFSANLIDAASLKTVVEDTLQNFERNVETIVPAWMGPACKDFMEFHWPTVDVGQDLQAKVDQIKQKILAVKGCK